MVKHPKLVWQLMLLACSLFYSSLALTAELPKQDIKIGVLAYNGKQQALARWQPTADYLARQINSHHFEILPLTHEEFTHAINKGLLDFILTNPGHYIKLEVKFGATRIATFNARYYDKVLTQFGSVIFVRADSNIRRLDDLDGRSMAAVGKQAFGGFQLAYNELLQSGIDAYDDLTLMWLGFPQSDIVREVLAGNADVGTVRSGILEKMAASGEIDLVDIRVLGLRQVSSFPLVHSTALYPEWPIARLPDTDSNISKQVAITLLQMPKNAVPAITSSGAGWTIPLDYLKVHELFRNLQIEPYPPVPLELKDFWRAYRHWMFLLAIFFVCSISAIFYTLRMNRQLQLSKRLLAVHGEKLETTIEHCNLELGNANRALQNDIESRIQFENTLHDGCETMHTLNTILNRQDLTRRQRMQSIVDLACQHLGQDIAVFSLYDGVQFSQSISSSGHENQAGPLVEAYARQSIEENRLVNDENVENWRHYLACSVHITNDHNGMLELGSFSQASGDKSEQKNPVQTEHGLEMLQLFAQWLASELNLHMTERKTEALLRDTKSRFLQMTERELEVLQLVSNGESNKSIARLLDISIKTVELHRSNLLRKTNAGSSVQLIKLATQSRIVN